MLSFLIVAIILASIAGVLFYASSKVRHGLDDALAGIGLITLVGAVVFSVLFGVFSFEWKQAEVQAKVINREYATEYTQEEVFYAADVIDTIRQLDRKRIEVNGALFDKE